MWLTLLKQAVDSTNCTAVAAELSAGGKQVSRTTISLVVNGKYPAKTDKIAAMVLNTYGKVECPFLTQEITLAECKQHHTSSVPTSSPRAMKHWRACQSCPNRKEQSK